MDIDGLEALVRLVQPYDRSALLLLANLRIDEATGCWEWTRYRDDAGYGQVGLRGHRVTPVHRAVWEAFVGPIPDGLTLDHLCRNPPCANPRHLEPVTNSENVRRRHAPASPPLAGLCRKTRSSYTQGCHCVDCREANRLYNVARRPSAIPQGV